MPYHYCPCYSYAPHVHSWPGQVKTTKRGGKHHGARKAAFMAKRDR